MLVAIYNCFNGFGDEAAMCGSGGSKVAGLVF